MTDFFPRDPAKALVEMKEELYARLAVVQENISVSLNTTPSEVIQSFQDEVQWLRDLLDKMERS